MKPSLKGFLGFRLLWFFLGIEISILLWVPTLCNALSCHKTSRKVTFPEMFHVHCNLTWSFWAKTFQPSLWWSESQDLIISTHSTDIQDPNSNVIQNSKNERVFCILEKLTPWLPKDFHFIVTHGLLVPSNLTQVTWWWTAPEANVKRHFVKRYHRSAL